MKISADKLRDFLRKNGNNSLFDETYSRSFDPSKMIYEHPELKGIPGYKDIFVNDDPIEDIPANLNDEQLDTYQKLSGISDSDKKRYQEKMASNKRSSEIASVKKEAEQSDRRKIVDEYQHRYFGLDKDNPVNEGLNWLADLVISDNTKNSISRDPDASVKIAANAAADILGTAADAIPGASGIVVGPTIRGVQDIANGNLNYGDLLKDYGVNIATSIGVKGIPGIQEIPGLNDISKKFNNTKLGKGIKKYNDKFDDKWNYKENSTFNTPTTSESIQGAKISEITTQDLEHITPSYENMFNLRKEFGKNDKMNISGRTDMKNKMIEEGIPRELVETAYKKDVANTTDLAKKAIEDRTRREFEENARRELYGKNASKDLSKADKAKMIGVEVVPQSINGYFKSWLRDKVQSDNETPKVESESEVLDYLINRDARMWDNGFKPHGGIELEAYQKYMGTK